ncbi:MAG: endopeptidase La [Clostridiales bacterium]|nr:endopeptidase La [Clostridiales bacterium]
MPNYIEKIDRTTLPVVPLRGIVAFPQNSISMELSGDTAIAALEAAKKDGMAFFVLQKNYENENPEVEDLNEMGTIAKIKQTIKMSDKSKRVIVEGVNRAVISSADKQGSLITADLLIKWTQAEDNGGLRGEAYMREAAAAFEQIVKYLPKLSSEVSIAVKSIKQVGLLADFLACHVLARPDDKQTVLEAADPMKRIKTVITLMYEETTLLETELDIHKRVQEHINANQRDYYLREQMKIIKSELGDDTMSEVDEYYDRIDAAHLPKEVAARLEKEVARMSKNPYGSAESTVSRNWLDTCLEFPWTKLSRDRADIVRAKKILDTDHDGLEKVKERILEFLAVRTLTPNLKTQMICLVGPPGVGKTSIGASIARSLGRKYVRVSLGGVRDEADIRGHRKTYIGAMPGRITNALIQAGTRNPVILLDEIDKLSNSHNGDPSAALLEVLDGEQNKAFRDHYMEMPIDLSECMFIATANTLETVPRPLIDRMELIEMKTYTRHEKLSIAKNHMITKQTKNCGLTKRQLKITDDAIFELIDYYTREAGVRNLERNIAALCRKAARKFVEAPETKSITIAASDIKSYLGSRKLRPDRIFDEDQVGVVNGLAYTEVGGDMLRIEVATFEGSGKLELTGSLGDVMKESAHIALSFVRSRANELGIDPEFYKKKDIHIHVPEGAVPKDGPSAGVTLVTAIASALSGMPVRRDIAMTGEVTLRGRVLAIGGLREKTLAAYSAGVSTVLIPEENLPDLEEIDPIVRESLEFIPVKAADEVLNIALVRPETVVGFVPPIAENVEAYART